MLHKNMKNIVLGIVLLLGVPSFCFGMEVTDNDSNQVSFPSRVFSGIKSGTGYIVSSAYEHPKLLMGGVLCSAGAYGIYRLCKYFDFATQRGVDETTGRLQVTLRDQTDLNIRYLAVDSKDTQEKIHAAKEKSKLIASNLQLISRNLAVTEDRADRLDGKAATIDDEYSDDIESREAKFIEHQGLRAKQALRLKSMLAVVKGEGRTLEETDVAAEQNLKALELLQQQFSLLQRGIKQKLFDKREAQEQLQNIQAALRDVNQQLAEADGQLKLADVSAIEILDESDDE